MSSILYICFHQAIRSRAAPVRLDGEPGLRGQLCQRGMAGEGKAGAGGPLQDVRAFARICPALSQMPKKLFDDLPKTILYR
jgi:hypothetical protein